MDKRNYAFGKINYILLVVGILIVVTGLFIMAGDGTTEAAFNPDIFSSRRMQTVMLNHLLNVLI